MLIIPVCSDSYLKFNTHTEHSLLTNLAGILSHQIIKVCQVGTFDNMKFFHNLPVIHPVHDTIIKVQLENDSVKQVSRNFHMQFTLTSLTISFLLENCNFCIKIHVYVYVMANFPIFNSVITQGAKTPFWGFSEYIML